MDPQIIANETHQIIDNPIQVTIVKSNQSEPGVQVTRQNLNLDQLPVGASKKFNISQYPDQNTTNKPVSRKPPLKKKKVEDESTIIKEEIKLPLNQNNQQKLAIAKGDAFDQKPIGKSNFNVSEFPQGQQPRQEKQVNLTLEQKLKSKAVKIRMTGFEELLVLINQNGVNDFPINPLEFEKLLKESNPACLEKIISAFNEWVRKEGAYGQQQIKQLIENGYINGKGTSKKLSMQLLDYIYDKKALIVEVVILNGLKGKTLKTVTGYITLVYELLAIYGIKKMNYLKPYYPDIIRLISTEKLPAIKTQGMTVLKQSLKWLGKQFLDPILKTNNIKEGLSKQLDQFWETHDKNLIMTAPKQDQLTKPGQKASKINLRELIEQVDVFKNFNEKWVENVLKVQKWKEKCDMMQQLVKEASVPKIANKQHRHIADLVKRLINDSNFNVVLMVLKILGAISQGLRKPFAWVVKTHFAAVIAKFRDKKTLMIEETNNCLNQFYYVITLEQVLEEVKQGLSDKNPGMKMHLIAWIQRYLERKHNEKSVNQKTKQAVRGLLGPLEKLCNDGVAEVREATAKAITKMKSILGDAFFQTLEAKVGKSFGVPSKLDVQQTKLGQSRQIARPKNKSLPKSTVTEQKPPTKPSNFKPEKKQQKIEDLEIPTYQQCYAHLLDLGVPQQILKAVTSANSKEKITLMELLRQKVDENNMEIVLKVLRKMYKEWKQSNLVLNKQLMVFLEQNAERINKRQFVILLPCILQKLGDNKFSESINNITEILCSRIPPKYIANHILKYLKPNDTKKILPKIYGQACVYLSQIIDKVSLNHLSAKQICEFAKESFQMLIAKKGATILFKKIYEYIGEQVKNFIDQATIKALDNQFKKVVTLSEAEKKPKVIFRQQALEQTKNEKTQNLMENIPRTDISNEVAKWLTKLNDQSNWQNRKDAGEAIDNLLSQSKNRVQVTGLSDLFACMKNRINDSNKQLAKLFVNITGHLFEAVGKDIKQHSKPLIYALVEVLSDKNEAIRKDALASLYKICAILGVESVISCMATPLQSDKVEQRIQILNFILYSQETLSKVDNKQFVKGIINGLCDKNKQIRSLSERLFQKAIEKVNLEIFRTTTKDFKPAFQKDLKLIFDKFDKNAFLNNTLSVPLNPSVKGNSPARSNVIPQQTMRKPPISSKKQTLPTSQLVSNTSTALLTRTLTQKSLGDKQMLNLSITFQGDEPLASTKYLSSYRQSRQQIEQQSPWTHEQIKEGKQEDLIQQINKCFRKDIATKMLSMNYKKVVEAGMIISKMCKDLSQHNSLREVYDVILKWIFLRIWGGVSAVSNLIEIIPQLLSILQKKSLIIHENEVLIVIGIIRQYLIASYPENRVPEQIHISIKCLVKLNSGDKILKCLLKQYNTDLNAIHKNVKKQCNLFFRESLNRLIKVDLMDYVSQEALNQISKNKQLNKDSEFVEMLYQKFNENVVNGYGFRRDQPFNNNSAEIIPPKVNHQSVHQNSFQNNHSLSSSQIKNNSNMQHLKKPPLNNSTSLHKVESHGNIHHTQQILNSQSSTMPINNVSILNSNLMSKSQSHLATEEIPIIQRLKFENYPYPPASNVLNEHLSKLYPPDDATLKFFQILFTQPSERILSELQTFAKSILACILKGTIELLNRRNQYTVEKLMSQLTLLQQALKCKHVIRNSGEVLYLSTQFVLKQLVYEDENKTAIAESFRQRGLEYKSEALVKIINGLMLRILQNAHPHSIIIVLFDLLIKALKKADTSQKTLSLMQKCISRVSNNYLQEFDETNVKQLFAKFHQYYCELQGKLRPEDQGINAFKTLVSEVSKEIRQNIWLHYEKAIKQSNTPDRYIIQFLQSLKIPYPDKPKPSHKQEQLRKITELLSKFKTYDSGISLLNGFLDQNPDFQIAQYFSSLNYQNKFISKVLNSLEGNFKRPPPRNIMPERPDRRSEERKNPISDIQSSIQQNNIENKIRNLRQKFDQLHQGQRDESHTPVAQRQDDTDPDRASEIRRRITEMKAKIHNVMR